MSQPYVGEIRLVGFNFAPTGWATCDGQLMAISQNDVLFTLIGTTYGGDGQQTFALPDLRGRLPVHVGTGIVIGQTAGVESVTVTAGQIPAHNHVANASSAPGDQRSPVNNHWARELTGQSAAYTAPANQNTVMPAPTGPAGGGQPHDNMAPFLTVNFVIALYGIYPSQN